MPVLHNRISNDALRARMLAETEPRTTISFYKYFTIADPQATRDALYQKLTALNVLVESIWRMKVLTPKSAYRKVRLRRFVSSCMPLIRHLTACA